MDIRVIDSVGKEKNYNIEAFHKDVISFGRQSDNDIVLNKDYVSRIHGVIYRDNEGYHIEDLGSTNGISVNGIKIKNTWIKEGDSIMISGDGGSYDYIEFVFYTPSNYIQNTPDQRTVNRYSSMQDTPNQNAMNQYNYMSPMPPQPMYGNGHYQQNYIAQGMAYSANSNMQWYKAVIYFLLFAWAFVYLMMGIDFYNNYSAINKIQTGMEEFFDYNLDYDELSEIYGYKIMYIAGIIASVSMIFYAMFVRWKLAGFKKGSLLSYYILSIVNALICTYYYFCLIKNGFAGYRTSSYYDIYNYGINFGKYDDSDTIQAAIIILIVNLFIAIVYVVINKMYFDKRKDMFIR